MSGAQGSQVFDSEERTKLGLCVVSECDETPTEMRDGGGIMVLLCRAHCKAWDGQR